MISRRAFVLAGGLLAGGLRSAAAGSLTAARLWPGSDHTRLTLESPAPIPYTHFLLSDPARLVIDLPGGGLEVLRAVAAQVAPTDPWLSRIRAGWHQPAVLRLVLELKVADCRPQVFELLPAGGYGHRLVIDLTGAERQPAELPPATAGGAVLRIMLDPGHGGEDPGAVGRNGSYEKHIVLAIARRLQRQLTSAGRAQVLLTRTGDYFVPLQERVRKAREARADLFLSVHADAWTDPAARGSSVFVLSEKGASSVQARWLAQHENEADLIGGVNFKRAKDPFLARTLLDLSQTATNIDSQRLAHQLLREMARLNPLHKDQVEQAGFAVLKAPDIPSVLIETAFISNPAEERKLNDVGFQEDLAAALMRGVLQFRAS